MTFDGNTGSNRAQRGRSRGGSRCRGRYPLRARGAPRIEEDAISTVLFDDLSGIEADTRVSGAGGLARVPAGPERLGRIVDPLGRPLDNGDAIARGVVSEIPAVDRPAPAGKTAFATCRGSRRNGLWHAGAALKRALTADSIARRLL
ncbi:hypothetical protein SPHV1_220015 [Novosphingobium sp. KN65.2]|nr:hypothetical protein SPHV1_220015 [Novosphingobium sp. KN65.2]